MYTFSNNSDYKPRKDDVCNLTDKKFWWYQTFDKGFWIYPDGSTLVKTYSKSDIDRLANQQYTRFYEVEYSSSDSVAQKQYDLVSRFIILQQITLGQMLNCHTEIEIEIDNVKATLRFDSEGLLHSPSPKYPASMQCTDKLYWHDHGKSVHPLNKAFPSQYNSNGYFGWELYVNDSMSLGFGYNRTKPTRFDFCCAIADSISREIAAVSIIKQFKTTDVYKTAKKLGFRNLSANTFENYNAGTSLLTSHKITVH